MALHRAEQIAAALLAALTGLTSTGLNAFRGRALPVEVSSTPALLIYSTSDQPLDVTYPVRNSALSVLIEGHALAVPGAIETTLNAIRKEVTIAIRSAPTLGLGFVIESEEGGADYELFGDSEQPGGIVRMTWTVMYRRGWNDPSA